jgi:hypothetical protein
MRPLPLKEVHADSPPNKATFVQVLALEAAIIAALWILGRMFT